MPDCTRGVLEVLVDEAPNPVVELVCLIGVLAFVDPNAKPIEFDENSIMHFSLGQLDVADATCFEIRGGIIQ